MQVAFAEGVSELADRLRFFVVDERQRRVRADRAAAYARATHDLGKVLSPLWDSGGVREIQPPRIRAG